MSPAYGKRRETVIDEMQSMGGGMCYDWRDEDELDRPDAPITATGLALWIPLALLWGAAFGYGIFRVLHAIVVHRG